MGTVGKNIPDGFSTTGGVLFVTAGGDVFASTGKDLLVTTGAFVPHKVLTRHGSLATG